MDLRNLLSILNVYSHNFRMLHWNAKGKKFDRIHKLANEYYTITSSDIDIIAEMAIRLDLNPVGYQEAFEMLNDSEHEYLIVAHEGKNDFNTFIENTDIMLKDILECIEEIHASDDIQESHNMGIKSDLEALYSKYDLQYRYINKMRSFDVKHEDDEENDD